MNKQEYDKEVKRLKEKKQNIREVIAQAKQALAEAQQFLKDHDLERLKLECVKLYGRELKEGDIVVTPDDPNWVVQSTRFIFVRYDKYLCFTYVDKDNKVIPNSGVYWADLTSLRQPHFKNAKLITP